MSYPVKEIEYGTYSWLMREVGGYLFGKFDEAEWTHSEREQIDSIVQSGVRQFYNPPALPAEEHKPQKSPHNWTFMQPMTELILENGTKVYDLPEDFSGIVGDFTVQA